MRYIDGLLKALELVQSYVCASLDAPTNAMLRAIAADLELEIMRYRREQSSVHFQPV